MKHIRLLYTSGLFYFFLLCGCGLFTILLSPQTAYGAENASGLAAAPGTSAAAVKTVQVDIANIRIKPSVKSAILTKLAKGDRVEIVGRQGSWLAVKLPDSRLGWAHRNLFSTPRTYPVDTDAEKLLSAIQSEIISKNKEMVTFKLSGNYPPETFVTNIEQPKVVCDFAGLLIGSDIGRIIKVNGTLIEQIRVAYHEKPTAKVRVVVDLVPDRKYKIKQTFYRLEHIFELAIQPDQ
ncbi:MAG: SH3 domain-containing protein [Deltaproteobacteria bacterium]|nr:SH3 domain-containing protein [Deltaproteobacteria bacterium]